MDEFVLADSIKSNNSVIGGLSGVDFANGYYYFVVDDSRKPRFVKSKIKFDKDTITSIDFIDVIYLNDSTETFYNNTFLDLESIFVDEETQEINFVSEGSIVKGKSPSVFTTDALGKLVHNYTIPSYFIPNKIAKLKHNGAFEGSSKSVDNKGFWIAMESPLIVDGDEPTFKKTSSPIRITYFDKTSKKATKQFAYQLEHITKPSKGKVNLNGLTAILEYKENHFFIIERTYQSGYGAHGNIIRIFEATVANETTNILNVASLRKTDFIPLKKKLLFNFENVENKLTDGIIDNIEGITFGPTLANGNKSLLLVSDDNFQLYGKQLNQLLLLEIVEK
ncbi:esterase-like activity of phytase family protein [Tenacibaculum todarodis]|uniref:esterase-like activity of phytase family protein n=1 Tax=Tenacibaculum todarodis TaxID=1850252 RepID=UPI0013012A16|nr:esterase-like activity of phytase family protein [Tenacibaculum todarodis]